MIDRVTITGADDSIRPDDLIPLTQEFPFVEWGILASANNTISRGGVNRYPSARWISEIQRLADSGHFPNLALHINGFWVRRLLLGESHVVPFDLWDNFARVQLNFHAENNPCQGGPFSDRLREIGKQWIFQLDGENGNAHLDTANEFEVPNCRGLFDVSGGAGVLPDEWPKPIYLDVFPGLDGEGEEQHAYHGYAGGLGPHNLAEQIPRILEAAAGTEHTREGRIWIDMETHVRSGRDTQFDMNKVRKCLEIAAPFVNPS